MSIEQVKQKFNILSKTKDILNYESDIWASADILRSSVGLKASEFPDFMMPFFALRMVESRMIRKFNEYINDDELQTLEDKVAEMKDFSSFYNSKVIEDGVFLIDIVQNDKTFKNDFINYLNAFDDQMKSLLGIDKPDPTENLNLMNVVDALSKKKVLFGYVKAWANIDFTSYDNSEITTLEEHIKRKWADMSAETAGEQYTPDDIINLIGDLISVDEINTDEIYNVYDMTCGGGNMLFGVEDRLKSKNPNAVVETWGQELRGSLYALAKIESMFRVKSNIEVGNTLTNDKFANDFVHYGVANPPYGVSWKEEQKIIEADNTGRFIHKPSVSDGQLLFVQHMLAKLNNKGKAFIVLNGSPMFSGDANSGESNIRKYLLDNDYVEAFIQLPTNEFFNTGITTYIWCLNKNKNASRKDKILCINAEEMYVKLKKNKGNKSREISPSQAKKIADIYANFIEKENISKVKSKYDFYFNKQSLKKLIKDDEFGVVENEKLNLNEFELYIIDNEGSSQLIEKSQIKLALKEFDYQNSTMKILVRNDSSISDLYEWNNDGCIIKNGENLGFGQIKFELKLNKKTQEENVAMLIEQVWEKDDEKIEYCPDEIDNQLNLFEFMNKWVSDNPKDYQLLDNSVGVEINFNSIFPKKIEMRKSSDILVELAALDKEFGEI